MGGQVLLEHGYRPEAGCFLSLIDKDMLGFVGVKSFTNARRIFLYRNLTILDFCESKYKEAQLRVAGLNDEVAKWNHYAQTGFKVERPRFMDTSLALAAIARTNHQLSARLDDAIAMLIESKLSWEKIFDQYQSTLEDRDALTGTVERLMREKEVVGVHASNASKRVLELEAKIK